MDRRGFVGRSAAWVVLIAGMPVLVRAQEGGPAGGPAGGTAGDTLTFTSSRDFKHVHTVSFARDVFESPPGSGIEKKTSTDQGHLHTVSLSEEQLRAVGAGETVEVRTSRDARHVHTFTFRLAG